MSWSTDADDLSMDVSFWYQGLHKPSYPQHQLGDLANELSGKFRAFGIMLLLGEAKSDLFLHNLMRSARMRLTYLERMQQAGISNDFFQASGHYQPVLAGIAAEDYVTVAALYSLSANDLQLGEYEDDRCYAQILFRLAALAPCPVADYQVFVDEYLDVIDGMECPRLDVVRSIIAGDQDEFDTAFSDFLDEFEDNVDKAVERAQHETPLVLAERAVCIEGLAMLRLADKHGLATEREYPYCPSLARLPMVTPLVELPR